MEHFCGLCELVIDLVRRFGDDAVNWELEGRHRMVEHLYER